MLPQTDAASLAELRDSVSKFQEKFRVSVVTGLLHQYSKRIAKKGELIRKWKKESERMECVKHEVDSKDEERKKKLDEV